MSFTLENATDQHSVVIVHLIFATTDEGKHIIPVRNTSFYYCVAFFPRSLCLMYFLYYKSQSNLCTVL